MPKQRTKKVCVSLDKVQVPYTCPECATKTAVDATFYQDNGTPVCPDCDTDMVADGDAIVTIPA